MNRVNDAKEVAGHGIQVQIDGQEVFIGNEKLMRAQNITPAACESIGTVIYVACKANTPAPSSSPTPSRTVQKKPFAA